jgi:hypothetical protein
MKKPSRMQKARAGLSLALLKLQQLESKTSQMGRDFNETKKSLRHAREVARLATQDARHVGLL